MASSSKSKVDLLVRVRFQNPLPPPPFPPKLIDIPTDLSRLADPQYLEPLAKEIPLVMMVDSEMGMPLDLVRYKDIWRQGVEMKGTHPCPLRRERDADTDPVHFANQDVEELCPKGYADITNDIDLSLLRPPSPHRASTNINRGAGNGVASTSAPNVSWLQPTRYLQNLSTARRTTRNEELSRLAESCSSHFQMLNFT